MDKETLLTYLIAAVIGLFIMFLVIKLAVRSAMNELIKQDRTRTRLMIKKLMKQGFDRSDIVETMNADETDFWAKL